MKKALLFASVASMIEQFNMDNIYALQKLGYSVDVACNFIYGSTISPDKVNELKSKMESIGVQTYHIPVPRKISAIRDMYKAFKATEQLFIENKYDIVHCHSPIGGVIARITSKKFRKNGTKIIYTAHGFHFYTGAPILNWILYYPIEKYCSNFTDVLITINNEDFQRAKKLNAGEVVYVPGIGVHIEEIGKARVDRIVKRKELGTLENQSFLLSVGELNDNKNQEVIIKALSKINVPYKYLICGIGYKKEYLQNLAKKYKIEDKVIFLGYRTDIKEILKSVDIFCIPSKREGLSVALMEAMAAGLPCVASRIRGNVDLVHDGKGGYLFDYNNVNEITECIKKLISNNKRCYEFGLYNKKYINNFSNAKVTSEMMQIYNK